MSLHTVIRAAREAKNWSMQQLADAISEAEGLSRPLAWQTIQQWESGNSAPKRTRMPIVFKVLGISPDGTTFATPDQAETPRLSEPASVFAAAGANGRPISTYHLLRMLAERMAAQDKSARAAIGGLIEHMCNHPEEGDITARRIVALMGVEEIVDAQKSSGSRP